jgi:hypothetical protein
MVVNAGTTIMVVGPYDKSQMVRATIGEQRLPDYVA